MNIITVEGKKYDLDAVSSEARTQIEQLAFLTTDLAKMLVPAGELPGKVEDCKKALAKAMAVYGKK